MECQIQMLRKSTTPVKVLKLLDLFLEMKLSKNVEMRAAFHDTSICYHVSQMIREAPPKQNNPFNNGSVRTVQTTNRSVTNLIADDDVDSEDGNTNDDDHDSFFIDGDYTEEQDEELVRKGCILITSLTYNDTTGHFIQQFAKNGTVDIVTRRMKQFRNNEALQKEGIMVMLYVSFADFDNHYSFTISQNNPNSNGGVTTSATTLTRVFNDSVLKTLCDSMKRYPTNHELQSAAMTCLRMISFKCQVIQDVIIERCQFLEVILKILKRNWKQSAKLVRVACEVLKLLASNPKEDARALIREKKGTMLLAEIEDHYRAVGRDRIADLALDVFTIVCKKYYFPTIDLGDDPTASTDSNHDLDEEDEEEEEDNVNLIDPAAAANRHYSAAPAVAATNHNGYRHQ